MKPKKLPTIAVISIFIGLIGISGCKPDTDQATFQTQVALAVQQTKVADDIALLTQVAEPTEQIEIELPTITITPVEVTKEEPQPTKTFVQLIEDAEPTATFTQRPTLTPRPVKPMLRADDDYFCRQRPDKYSEKHWMFTQGKNNPIIGKSDNGWWLISVSDPDTRTECCWVGGGITSGNPGSLPTITEEIDRLNCPKSP